MLQLNFVFNIISSSLSRIYILKDTVPKSSSMFCHCVKFVFYISYLSTVYVSVDIFYFYIYCHSVKSRLVGLIFINCHCFWGSTVGILGGQGGGIRLFFVTILLLKFIVLCFMVRMDKMNLF